MGRVGCSSLVIAGVTVAAQIAAAAPLRLTIDEAASRARAGNAELNASRKDLAVAQANLERSKAWLPSNPYVSGGAQSTTAGGVGPNYFFLLSQQFEVAGQRGVRVNAATAEVDKAGADVHTAELALVATVKTTFIQAQVSSERVGLAQQSADAAARLTGELADRKLTTDLQRLDLNVAQIQESRARRELASAERARDMTLNALRHILSLQPDQELELLGAPQSEVKEPPPVLELIDRALRQRPDLAALRHGAKNAELQLDLTKRASIPNITVSGTVSRFEGDTLTGGDIGVPLPIFQRNAPNIHEALAERDHAGIEAQQLEQTIQQEVRDARGAYVETGKDLQVLQRDIVPKSEENLAIEQRQFERGAVGVSDLVGIQIDLITARRDYLDALEAFNDALISLERAIAGPL